jgi:hypothetical protein
VIDHLTRSELFRREVAEKRPFEGYRDQPDTAERTRLAVQAIPFALPEKRDRPCR